MLALITALMLCSCEFQLEDIYEADIATLREAIQSGELSCHDLTQYYLDRIEKYNKDYNCFITMCDDALEIADKRDKALAKGKGDGLLFGIPVVIKDNMDYKGYETTNGHEKGSSYIATENSYVVQRLLDEGAIILGKTNMATDAETAINSFSDAVGDTKNAYNKECSPGGSSGGTAVAVSLNFAAAGLGTDTNSSLRIPAAFNGDVALRSTYDLIDRTGIVELNSTRDVVGAITRSVADQAIMMDVLVGDNYEAYEHLKNIDKKMLEGKKIGVIKELSDRKYIEEDGFEVDEEAYKLFENAKKELEKMGAELVEVSLPVYEYHELCWDTNNSYYRDEYKEIFDETMDAEGLYVMIYPDCPTSEMYLDEPETMDFFDTCKYIAPIIGVPDITVQIGNLESDVGVGMGILAREGRDQSALAVAYLYSTTFNHRVAPAGAPNLTKSK